ncbi:MAG: hypothetical protein ABWY93_18815 [Mycobacterium sp.]
MDISVRKTGPFRVEDRSWLGSAHGTTATRTVTLDTSAFTQATHFPNGYIASGTLVSRIDGSGLWGPYVAGSASTGHLFNSTPVTANGADVGAPVLEHGVVFVPNLPANSGLSPAARTELSDRGLIYRD